MVTVETGWRVSQMDRCSSDCRREAANQFPVAVLGSFRIALATCTSSLIHHQRPHSRRALRAEERRLLLPKART
ncbi:unnamed protein product [Gongylonema pulchrum]|uniref:Uncharacterized protein n=1 Tax=Gongylonema pulchrum TaxID=637853 RepID=A0A183EHP5_9BILA|nr:unnamed protein product [Gongylonema pulchrum]